MALSNHRTRHRPQAAQSPAAAPSARGHREQTLRKTGCPPESIFEFCEAWHAMTSADEAGRRGFLAPYAEIFAIPHAWQFSVAGIIGRLPMATYGLGIVLLISAGTG